MRILDRYAVRQLLPVWLWCLFVFVFLSCLIDLVEHLDEILRYHIPFEVIVTYYANFIPLVAVRTCPLAILFSAAFVASRLARHQEFLAMNASGVSLLQASVPFLFAGWLVSLCVFLINDRIVPGAAGTYERLRQEAFRGRQPEQAIENVAVLDVFNRLYHARQLNLAARELHDLTILEHDQRNQPTKSLYANRAIWTAHGWLLLYGRIYRVGAGGRLRGEPEPFVERLIAYPVTPESFTQPEAHPATMRYGALRFLITRLKETGIANVRRHQVELASKLTFPLMNMIICLIGFVWSTQPQFKGNLKGLAVSLGWGLLYYALDGVGRGLAEVVRLVPVALVVWTPHALAVWWCVRRLHRSA